MKVQGSIDIAAPPQKIWPFLVEPEKILKWCITYQKFEYTGDKRPGMGSTFYLEEKAGGPLMKLNFTVTEWEQNARLACKMTSGNFLKGYEQKMTLEAIPSGSRFTFMEDVKLPYGVIGNVMGLFARSSSQAHLKEMLAKLKSLAEA
jgi:uncharacterized protein YndB with AHSA1/START domain